MLRLLAVCVAALGLAGCAGTEEAVNTREVVEIDGCEYITVRSGHCAWSNYSFAITHKGNCKNPIHVYRKE